MKAAAFLLAAVVFASCGGRAGRIPADVAAWLPPDSVMLAGADLASLRKSPLYAKLRPSAKALEEMAAATGVGADDVDRVFAGMTGKGAASVALGRFQAASIEPKLIARGATRKDREGRPFFELSDGLVGFPRDGVAVGGTANLVKQGAGPAEALRRLADRVTPGAQVWAVSLGDLPARFPQGNLENLEKVLSELDSFVMSAEVTEGVHLALVGDCTDDAAAGRLRGALQGLLGLARLGVDRNSPFLKVFDAVQIGGEGKKLAISARLDAAQAEALAGAAGERR